MTAPRSGFFGTVSAASGASETVLSRCSCLGTTRAIQGQTRSFTDGKSGCRVRAGRNGCTLHPDPVIGCGSLRERNGPLVITGCRCSARSDGAHHRITSEKFDPDRRSRTSRIVPDDPLLRPGNPVIIRLG